MDTSDLLKDSPKIHHKDILYSENEEKLQNESQGGVDTSQDTTDSLADMKDDDIKLECYDSGDSSQNDEAVKRKCSRRLKEAEKLQIYSSLVFKEEFEETKRIRKPQEKWKIQPPTVKNKIINKDDGMFRCSRCPKEFSSKTGLLNHIRMHQTERKLTCAICYQTFDTNALLIAHKEVHIEEKRVFFCGQCKLAFTDHCDFVVHVISHTYRKCYKCVECGAFYSKNGYKTHVQMHYNKKRQCPICSLYYVERSIKSHINSHSSTAVCVECGKDCKTAKMLQCHMYNHTGVKPYQCLYCGKGFISATQRTVHTRLHTDERPYNCDLCDKTFKQLTDMQRHRETHEKLKRFQCDYCKKKFMHKMDLRSHIRRHIKQDLYYCPECKASFTTSSGLTVHVMFKHTSERPVKCEVCNKGFINKNQLQKHSRTKYHKRNVYGLSLKSEQ